VKLAFISLALAAELAVKVCGILWPIAEIGTNPKIRISDANSVFLVFISIPFLLLLPMCEIPGTLIPDQSGSST
jgi:hypothetical protein